VSEPSVSERPVSEPTAPLGLGDIRATGDRIEQMLDELESAVDAATFDRVAEVLRLVVGLYGEGLASVMQLARQRAPALVDALADDELVASLLVVHGLHPRSMASRVEQALDGVRPMLGSHAGDVELVAVDEERGAVQLRLLGSCDGCPSSSVTLQMAVERAILEAAPEVLHIEVAQPSPVARAAAADRGVPAARAVPSVPVSLVANPRLEPCPAAEMAGP
jgi:Fe-S cluster biogenesis protein NfuA